MKKHRHRDISTEFSQMKISRFPFDKRNWSTKRNGDLSKNVNKMVLSTNGCSNLSSYTMSIYLQSAFFRLLASRKMYYYNYLIFFSGENRSSAVTLELWTVVALDCLHHVGQVIRNGFRHSRMDPEKVK